MLVARQQRAWKAAARSARERTPQSQRRHGWRRSPSRKKSGARERACRCEVALPSSAPPSARGRNAPRATLGVSACADALAAAAAAPSARRGCSGCLSGAPLLALASHCDSPASGLAGATMIACGPADPARTPWTRSRRRTMPLRPRMPRVADSRATGTRSACSARGVRCCCPSGSLRAPPYPSGRTRAPRRMTLATPAGREAAWGRHPRRRH